MIHKSRTFKIIDGVKLIALGLSPFSGYEDVLSDCVATAQLHSIYNHVELSRGYRLWGFNPVPLFALKCLER